MGVRKVHADVQIDVCVFQHKEEFIVVSAPMLSFNAYLYGIR